MNTNMENKITKERALVIIENLLKEIVDKTCIADEPTAYIPWLTLEVGMTEAEIEELKSLDRFPEPVV